MISHRQVSKKVRYKLCSKERDSQETKKLESERSMERTGPGTKRLGTHSQPTVALISVVRTERTHVVFQQIQRFVAVTR